VDAVALRAHGYALIRCGDFGSADPRRAYFRRRLEQEHQAGDAEATFLLGMLELATTFASVHMDDAEPWFRSAANAGHRQAAFELGVVRAGSADEDGALYWYRRAAEAGHPGAAYELAWALRATDGRRPRPSAARPRGPGISAPPRYSGCCRTCPSRW
jgi:TPR repeat protein